ncbi:helix-turn-helix domain-containing protein [Nonomuraea sp. NPDC050790]|uniref:helix-turn-helix domain-containing protein n=1 Tax=Nonomuraea sp. NPDC050790 TaxID=3364371 RepID=UPI0037AC8BC3
MLVPEAAKILRCSSEYLYAGLRKSRFPGTQVGRAWRMPRAFVTSFVRDVLSVGQPTSFEEYAAAWLARNGSEVAA